MSGRGYNRAAGSAQLTIEAAIKIDPMVLRQQIGEAKGEGFTTRAEDDPPPPCTCAVGGRAAAPECPRHAPEAP